MKLTLSPRVVRGPFAFAFGLLLALCLGLAGCASPPLASGYGDTLKTNPLHLAGNADAPGRHSGRDRRYPDCMDAPKLRHPWNLGSGGPCRNDGEKLNSTALTSSLRQFTAGGHVLGFAAGSVLVATGSHALKVEFVNANPVGPQSDQPGGDGKDNKAPALTEVRYPGLWQGIDLAYKSDPKGIAETVWKVEPGADINKARLRYNRPLALNKDGSLTISYATGTLTESAPVAWQEKGGQRQPVAVAFALEGGQELGFHLGAHEPNLPVWIDPTLSWNTFLGAGYDFGYAIAVDGSGNVYVAGRSGATWGNPLRAFGGGSYDAFAAKLDSSGHLVWNTFLGGAGDDSGKAIAVDGSGNVHVVGTSTANWGSPQRAYGGGQDAFVAKLDSTGQIVWNTFLGGAEYDEGYAIAVDGSGNAYVAGASQATWGSPQRAFGGSLDAFAAKLDSAGQLVWNTFLGGTGWDEGHAIAVDERGNVYVAGYSVATWGSPQRAFVGGSNGGTDAFAAKLDSSTGQLVWSTFLGGAGSEDGYAIAVDGSGNAYVAGYSEDTWGSPQRAFSGGYGDAFATKLDSLGYLVWNTFLGGEGYDSGSAIAVDGSGNAYVAGDSYYNTWGSPQRAFSGGIVGDAYAAQLDGTGKLVWNTFLGGAGTDHGFAITVDGSGNAYVAGYSAATWGSPQRAFSSGVYSIDYNAFVAKLASVVTPTTTAVTANTNPSTYGQTVTFTATVTGSGATPTGTVTFKADNIAIAGCGTNGAVNLMNGSATCTTSTLTIASSPHAITAAYSGDATYAASSGSLANGQTVNKANASVTAWPTASAITYGQTLASSALSGGAATPAGSFAFTLPATLPNAGTAAQSVTYTPTDTANYNAATNTVSVTVNKANQTILFGPTPSLLVGDTATLSATGGLSGNPVTFSSATTGVCTVSGINGNTVSGVAGGTCTIAANQAGNANYNPALQVTQDVSVTIGFTLTISNGNNAGGTVTSNTGGINCGGTCVAAFATGSSVTLTATADPGYFLSQWGGACAGAAPTCTVTMDAAKNVTANFARHRRSVWKRALAR
jgi:hypothetical protein